MPGPRLGMPCVICHREAEGMSVRCIPTRFVPMIVGILIAGGLTSYFHWRSPPPESSLPHYPPVRESELAEEDAREKQVDAWLTKRVKAFSRPVWEESEREEEEARQLLAFES